MEDKQCNCYERVNEGLAPHNTKIEQFYLLDSDYVGRPYGIRTTQIEKGRGKPKAHVIFASYCPFCGAHVRKPKQTEQEANAA